jgi:hypothetical protein
MQNCNDFKMCGKRIKILMSNVRKENIFNYHGNISYPL